MRILKLPHIARPALRGKHGQGLLIDGFSWQPLQFCAAQESAGEIGDILGAFPERWQAQGDHIQAIEKIFRNRPSLINSRRS